MMKRVVCVFIIIGVVFAQNRYSEKCGIQTSANQYPWLVIIEHEYTYGAKTRIHCTGALISNKHVVCTASCFDLTVHSGTAKSVRFGYFNTIARHDYDSSKATNGILRVSIETVTIDPDYSTDYWGPVDEDMTHDIAIITLRDVVPYTENIRPICLPTVDVTRPDTHSKLYVVGVSDRDYDKYEKRKTVVTYLDKTECTSKRYDFSVFKDDLCTILAKDTDPCQYSFVDGLLMNKVQDRFELVGVGMLEASCMIESKGRIRGFKNVFIYRNWIRNNTIEWTCGMLPSEDRFAWLAAIEYKYRNQQIEVACSGALISSRHVICKAECFSRREVSGTVQSVLGLHNKIDGINCNGSNNDNRCTDDSAVRIPIKMVITHPEYTRSYKVSEIHDIALVILSEMVTYSDAIRPICLPSFDVTQLDAANRDLYVNELNFKGPSTEIKRRSAMTYVDKRGCREVLHNYVTIFPDDLMCVKHTESVEPNSCLHSGDLLINKIQDSYELVGLAKLNNCGETKVFTNVYRSMDWLRSVIPEWTHDCGRRKVEHVELMMSGESNKPGDWPWHVAVYRMKNTTYNYKYICGGTLISKNMVLTAAHCVVEYGEIVNSEFLKVILGKYNLNVRELQSQERYVQSIIVHEAFAPFNHQNNDIALLKLGSDANYNDYVQPACLWSNDVSNRLPTDKNLGTVIGWGVDETNIISSRLKHATIPLVPDVTCIRRNPMFYTQKLDNGKKFCAGWANGTSPCNGDSGGGFFTFVPDSVGVSTSPGSWYIRGIVSLTPQKRNLGQCDPTQYVVFTDISNYTDWIQTHFLHSHVSTPCQFMFLDNPRVHRIAYNIA